MSADHGSTLETKRALLRAAAVAQCANEEAVTASRIAAALARTDSVQEFWVRAGIDGIRLLRALEQPPAPSFAECESRVVELLEMEGFSFGSPQHLASMQPRPMAPSVRDALDPIIAREGAVVVSPLELLLKLIATDPALARSLRAHGLDAKAIQAALEHGV